MGTAFAALCVGCVSVPDTVDTDPSLAAIQIPNTQLHIRTFGARGLPIAMVLHGGPGADSRYLEEFAQALSGDYFVVLFDQRGTGLSSRQGAKDIVVSDYLEDIDALVDRFSPTLPVHLIGHSWGAMLASAYAAERPDRVAGLVLAEPGFLTYAEFQHTMAAVTSGPGFGDMVRLGGSWILKWTLFDEFEREDYFFGQIMARVQPREYFCEDAPVVELAMNRAGAHSFMATAMRAMEDDEFARRLDFRRGAEKRQAEVLFLAGACDSLIGGDFQRRHMAYFSNPTLEVIADAGHYMFNEQLSVSLEAVLRYLGRIETIGAGGSPHASN